MVGVTLVTLGSIPLLFLNDDIKVRWLIFPLAFITGIGLVICLNTSISLIADVIGDDSKNSAFVFGIYSFFDKVVNGLLLYYIVGNFTEDRPDAVIWIIGALPVCTALTALLLTYIG